jgi:hypothetical protein
VVRYAPAEPADSTIDPLTPMWIFPAIFLIAPSCWSPVSS